MAERKFKPLLLATQQLLSRYWEEVVELLIDAPVLKEYTTDSLLELALAGQMFVFAVFDDTGKLTFVLIAAPQITPELNILNIVSVAGSKLRAVQAELWEFFRGWCFMNGVRAIDAYVPSERLESILSSFGFQRESIHVRAII